MSFQVAVLEFPVNSQVSLNIVYAPIVAPPNSTIELVRLSYVEAAQPRAAGGVPTWLVMFVQVPPTYFQVSLRSPEIVQPPQRTAYPVAASHWKLAPYRAGG